MKAHITDHALLRYIERVMGIDTAPIIDAMMTPALAAAIGAGARAVTIDGYRYTLDPVKRVVVTVEEAVGPARREARHAKKFFRSERVGDEL